MPQNPTPDPLLTHMNRAIAGETAPLFTFLRTHSGLPGTRVNANLAEAFADHCVALGSKSDALIRKMCMLNPDEAPGGTPLEYLPVCGVFAIAKRAAKDPKRRRETLGFLHDSCDDFRFRVRESIPWALAQIGKEMGDVLVRELATWTDGFHHAAHALEAIVSRSFLEVVTDTEEACARLSESYELAAKAPRSAERAPGYKALLEILPSASIEMALRLGQPVVAVLDKYATAKDPKVRMLILQICKNEKFKARFGDEVRSLRTKVEKAAPETREDSRRVKGTRGRGKRNG